MLGEGYVLIALFTRFLVPIDRSARNARLPTLTPPSMGNAIESESDPGPATPLRKYYPRSAQQHRIANQFFRTTSLQLHFDEHGSPLPKRPKLCAGPPESCHSLPVPQPIPPLELESAENSKGTAYGIGPENSVDAGPITTAVISKGLKAKVANLSSWFLSEGEKGSILKRTSLRTSTSFAGSSKLRQSLSSSFNFGSFASLRSRRKRKAEPSSNSNLSLNSLEDGRTPWPIPWLEAVFLPEYPNRGPVNETHFKVIGTIASGAWGKVYRVALRGEGRNIFAMKVQSKADVISQGAIQQMKDQVSIHESVGGSPFIAQLYASWQSRKQLFTVLHYATGYGDLFDLWRDMGPFSEDVVRIFVAEISLALDYVHSASVIFRDLKLENIVLDERNHVLMVDFGLAKWLSHGDRTRTICGTLEYMAPEIAAGEPYGHSVDWWSLGVLMYILLVGRRPFPSAESHHDLRFDVFQPPSNISPPALECLTKLLEINPEERISSLNELQTQPWLNSVDFNNILAKEIDPGDLLPRLSHCLSCNNIEEMDDEDEALDGFDEDYEGAFNDLDSIRDLKA